MNALKINVPCLVHRHLVVRVYQTSAVQGGHSIRQVVSHIACVPFLMQKLFMLLLCVILKSVCAGSLKALTAGLRLMLVS